MNSDPVGESAPAASAERRQWMGILARADAATLADAWDGVADKPCHEWIRPPETGMMMVRARTDGTGRPFNLGEMTVTRCALRTANGVTGIAYVRGRDKRHAELAALFDALMQDPARRRGIAESVIAVLGRQHDERRAARRRRAAATKVEFFTMSTEREEP